MSDHDTLDGCLDLATPGPTPDAPHLMRLHGEKGGGGSSRQPVEAPNTLRSHSYAYVLDLLAEGECWGIVGGGKGIFLDETPLLREDGSSNFDGVTVIQQNGTPTQAGLGAFPVGSPLPLQGGEVKAGHPDTEVVEQAWERQITDTDLDAVRIVVQIPALYYSDKATGDLRGNEVRLVVEVRQTTGSYQRVYDDTISGKCVSPYERSYRVDLPGTGPWWVRVARGTYDAVDSSEAKSTHVTGVIGLKDDKFIYPHSALVGLIFDAEKFGGSIPRRAYRLRGCKVAIPSNYDPWTRTYNGVWDGSFAYEWTNNPAWIFYDLLTHPRRGLGDLIDVAQVDKWALYTVAQYCDGWHARPWNAANDYSGGGRHGVPDGKGGFEPRFTFNGVINSPREAYQVLQALASTFRGMTYWSTGAVTVVQDAPRDSVQLVAPANVKDGQFSYASSSLKERHSVCEVSWNDPDDFYRQTVERVENPEALQRYGYRLAEIAAFGCTSRAQAHRLGKWLLDTELNETEVLSYTCGLDHLKARPGDIISVADPAAVGARYGGRVALPTEEDFANGAPVRRRANYVRNNSWVGRQDGDTSVTIPGWLPLVPAAMESTLASGRAIVGHGLTPTGRPYIDVLFWNKNPANTLAGDMEVARDSYVPSKAGDPWFASVHAHVLSATGVDRIVSMVQERNAGGGVLHETASANMLTAALAGPTRLVASRTLTNSLTTQASLRIRLGGTAGLPVRAVVRLWDAQLEPATSVTDPIPTAGKARVLNENTQTLVALDAPVRLEGSDVLSVVRADGSIMSAAVDFAPGPQRVLRLSSALPEIPAAGAMWVLTGGVTKPRPWRIMSIKESAAHTFDVHATAYDATKYLRVEFDYQLPRPIHSKLSTGIVAAPTDFAYREELFRSNNTVRSRVLLSWGAGKDSAGSPDSRVTSYDIEVRGSSGLWSLLGSAQATSYEWADPEIGDFAVRIYSRSPFGRSRPLESSLRVLGKSAPPANVVNFVAQGQINGTLLRWDEVSDLDLVGYEIREGQTWDVDRVAASNISRVGDLVLASVPGHNFKIGDSIVMENAADLTYNGRAQVLNVPSANSISFRLAGPGGRCPSAIVRRDTTLSARMKGTSLFVPLADTDAHPFLIKAVDDTGNYSKDAAITYGRVTAPDSVTSVTATPDDDYAVLEWPSVPGIDVEYEVRAGSSWEFGAYLGRTSSTSFRCLWPSGSLATFWVKARSKLGLYSATAVFAQCLTANPGFRNTVLSVDHRTAGWPGAARNMEAEGLSNTLAVKINRIVGPSTLGGTGWTRTDCTIVADEAAHPEDGTMTIDRLVETSATSVVPAVSQDQWFLAGISCTASVVVAPSPLGQSRRLVLAMGSLPFGGTEQQVTIDTATGAVLLRTVRSDQVSVDALPGGFFRVSFTALPTVSGKAPITIRSLRQGSPPAGSYPGDGLSGLLLGDVSFAWNSRPLYGDYFVNLSLPSKMRARVWVDADAALLDTNKLRWQDADFSWDSEKAATTSWIASGEEYGATVRRMIALRRDNPLADLPADLVDAAELNGNLSTLRGAWTLHGSAAIGYRPHGPRLGLGQETGSTTARWDTVASGPANWTWRFTLRLVKPYVSPGADAVFLWRDSTTPTYSMIVGRRANDGVLYVQQTGSPTLYLTGLEYADDDYVTVVLSNHGARMRAVAYSHRMQSFAETEGTYILPPALRFVTVQSVANFSQRVVIGNLELYSTSRDSAAMRALAEQGLLPVTFRPWQPLVPGDYEFQEAIVGIMAYAPAGTGRPALADMKTNVDVPDVTEQGNVEITAAGWTTFTFAKRFNVAPGVMFWQRGGAGAVAVGEVRNVTTTGFEARLRNTSGTDVTGSASYIAVGY